MHRSSHTRRYLAHTAGLHFATLPWALGLFLLAVRPIDVSAIRFVAHCCCATLLVCAGLYAHAASEVPKWHGGNLYVS